MEIQCELVVLPRKKQICVNASTKFVTEKTRTSIQSHFAPPNSGCSSGPLLGENRQKTAITDDSTAAHNDDETFLFRKCFSKNQNTLYTEKIDGSASQSFKISNQS